MTPAVISLVNPEAVALALVLVVGVAVVIKAVAFIKDKLERY